VSLALSLSGGGAQPIINIHGALDAVHNGEVLHHFATQRAGEGGGELEPQRNAQALAVGRDTLAGRAPFFLES